MCSSFFTSSRNFKTSQATLLIFYIIRFSVLCKYQLDHEHAESITKEWESCRKLHKHLLNQNHFYFSFIEYDRRSKNVIGSLFI